MAAKEKADSLAFVSFSKPKEGGGKKKGKMFTLFDHMPSDFINLQMGAPGEPQLKRAAEILKEATMHKMTQPDSHFLMQYGPEVGDGKYLEAVATFLTEQYQAPVHVDYLMTTAGASHGLYTLSSLLFSPGDLVFVDNPTYFIATKVFSTDLGLQTKTVLMDEQGIIPEELEKVLEANKHHRPRELTEKKPFWAILYLVPTFHNPCGMCLPPERCERIVEIARKYNLLVICDDVYNLLYFGDSTPHRLFAFDRITDPNYKGNVVSNGSFSKIFGPGMRLGWLELPERVKDIILHSGYMLSNGGFNHTISGLMESVLSLGLLKRMLEELRPQYREKCQAVSDALRAKIPSVSFVQPKGGYFMWLHLPDGITGEELAFECEKLKVTFIPGNLASPTGDFRDYIRISISHYDTDTMLESVERLGKAVNTLQSKNTSQ